MCLQMNLLVAVMLSSAPSNVHLLPTELASVPAVQSATLGSVGGRIGAIKQIVAGSVLLVIAAAFASPGIYLLSRAQYEADPTALLAVGWTLTGVGMLFAAIGIPLFVVGIVRNALYSAE